MKAENVADSRPAQRWRTTGKNVVVDVDGLRHGPAAIENPPVKPDARALAIDGIHRQGRGRLEEWQVQAPREVLRDVQRLASAKPDDGAHLAEIRGFPVEVGLFDRPAKVGPAVGTGEVTGEERPEVVHRDHEEGRIDEMAELVQQAATEHGRKAVGKILGVIVRQTGFSRAGQTAPWCLHQ